ncbi:hypothetical protein [Actinotalea sp. C106]|nr:hypothetical protein [Actinotalea sp. C106]
MNRSAVLANLSGLGNVPHGGVIAAIVFVGLGLWAAYLIKRKS